MNGELPAVNNDVLGPKDVIAVGFGETTITRDGVEVYSELKHGDFCANHCGPTFEHVERWCAADPEHDWRICYDAPLWSGVYQRHRDGKWYCIQEGEGFA